MSRLTEWMEREECLLSSTIKELASKIDKAQKDINAFNSEMEEVREDLGYLHRMMDAFQEVEKEMDANGQLKLEGIE